MLFKNDLLNSKKYHPHEESIQSSDDSGLRGTWALIAGENRPLVNLPRLRFYSSC